jgi:hypothetical protein
MLIIKRHALLQYTYNAVGSFVYWYYINGKGPIIKSFACWYYVNVKVNNNDETSLAALSAGTICT